MFDKKHAAWRLLEAAIASVCGWLGATASAATPVVFGGGESAPVLKAAIPSGTIGPLLPPPTERQPDQLYHQPALVPFVPNDPYFVYNNPASFPGQWWLRNQTPSGGPDINVWGAWARGWTGGGVTIGVVDTGAEHTHEDLAANYRASDSWDFGQNDPDPSPVYPTAAYPNYDDHHGTATAGIAAARGGNGIGITGVAPRAGLAILRVDFPFQTPEMFAAATAYHSTGANPTIHIVNHSYGSYAPYARATQEIAALAASTQAGTIHVYAAGNERFYHEWGYVYDINGNRRFDPGVDMGINADANRKQPQNAIQAITVAGLASNGKYANYSDWGANVFVTAPAGAGATPAYYITTTDRSGAAGYNTGRDFPDGNYTLFAGTSAAAPIVAGVLALGKQANPQMDLRMAKHLLARTSAIIDPDDQSWTGGWKTNAAGLRFNPNYGFGLIDADAFTQLATQVIAITPSATETTGLVTLNTAIPNGGYVATLFSLNSTTPLEEVEVYLKISHRWRGQLDAALISPRGTVSQFFWVHPADSWADIDWTFVTNAFWGENPQGLWWLLVADEYGASSNLERTYGTYTGTWERFSVTCRLGDIILVPEPATVVLLFMAAVGAIPFAWRRKKE